MVNKEIVERGEKYNDLIENNEAFKHLISEMHAEIESKRNYLEQFSVSQGNPQEALSYISTIQALNWVLDLVDENIQAGIDEARNAAIRQDPQDPD